MPSKPETDLAALLFWTSRRSLKSLADTSSFSRTYPMTSVWRKF